MPVLNVTFVLFIIYIKSVTCWMLLLWCELNSLVVRRCWSEWVISLIFTELQITNFPPRRWKHTKHSLCLDSIKQSWLHSPPCGAGEGGEEGEVALCWSTVETLSSYLTIAGLFKHTLRPPQRCSVFSTCPCVFKTGRTSQVVFRRQK